MNEFQRLQAQIGAIYAVNKADSNTPHCVVVLPSFSVGESLLSHYASRLPALEHRFLLCLMNLRMPATRILYVCSARPAVEVVEHYFSLLQPSIQSEARKRFQIIVADDPSARPVAAKLLDRPDLIEEILAWVGDDPAFIEPWNVAEPEQKLALRLGLPLFGTPTELWPMGFKSAGRKLLSEAGVPIPSGIEDLSTVAAGVAAIDRLRALKPELTAVILKHDDSGAGDGNAVIRVDDLEPPGSEVAHQRLRSRINSLEHWYVDELKLGFVVEEMIIGDQFSSPSAQLEIGADGTIKVLSTHEQILGGDDGQVYQGCRFPAASAYAPELGRHAHASAEVLARRGALGRVAIDFVAASAHRGRWTTYAIEVNLRKTGTTHPFAVLRHLVPGVYDPELGIYLDEFGQEKYYTATDNLVDEAWTGISEGAVIAAIADAGIGFDLGSRTGVVPHMLSCLAIDGRFGITAIANSRTGADELYRSTVAAITQLAMTRN